MLKKLDFKVQFSNGKTLSGSHTFEKGLTAITGPNESGKSFRLEMIRFAWFGSKALRAPVSSYADTQVTSEIMIGGDTYVINRSNSKATLTKNGKPLASGIGPVNTAVTRIFGYDLDVFDSANACLQGEVEALTNKTPAERKKMVDKTIGLDVIDDMIKEYAAQILTMSKAKATIESKLGEEPVKPYIPITFLPPEEFEKDLELYRHSTSKRQEILNKLEALECSKPDEPVLSVTQSLDELYAIQANRKVLQSQINETDKAMSAIPVSESNKLSSELASLEAFLAANGPELYAKIYEYNQKKAQYSNTLYVDDNDYKRATLYFTAKPLVDKWESLKGSDVVQCPECSHSFCLAHKAEDEALAQLKSVLSTEEAWREYESGKYFIECGKVRSQSALDELYAVSKEQLEFLRAEAPEEPLAIKDYGKREFVEQKIIGLKAKLDSIGNYPKLETKKYSLEQELSKIPVVDDLIQLKYRDDEHLRQYSISMSKWDSYVAYKTSVEQELKDLEAVILATKDIPDLYAESLRINGELKMYEVRKSFYEKVREEALELGVQIEELTSVRAALVSLKPKVKSYLVPSLARVASNFLSQMTNNVRNRVDINDSFDITIDGQPVETLSGSGKAVANLAVRLGLGTVLTNKVFSVLLADEIDASMDDDRAAYTAQCLRNLTKVFGQIILVSHQKPVADHYIEL